MVWLASSAAGDLATATPDTRAANFYAADLELPLLRMRAGATLVESCIGRLRRACNAEQRKHATDRRTIALLDELSLFPQRLINVPVPKGYDWKANDAICAAQAGTVTALGNTGRVLLRPSGTEPVLRVMVEAREAGLADKHAQALADVIVAAAGA